MGGRSRQGDQEDRGEHIPEHRGEHGRQPDPPDQQNAKIALARSYGASTFQIFAKIRFPLALPMIIVGYMVGSIFGLLTAIGGEMVAASEQGGLGKDLVYYSSLARMADFGATILISVLTRQKKSDEDLKGLVWALTPKLKEHGLPWWKTPEGFGLLVLALAVVLNVVFW